MYRARSVNQSTSTFTLRRRCRCTWPARTRSWARRRAVVTPSRRATLAWLKRRWESADGIAGRGRSGRLVQVGTVAHLGTTSRLGSFPIEARYLCAGGLLLPRRWPCARIWRYALGVEGSRDQIGREEVWSDGRRSEWAASTLGMWCVAAHNSVLFHTIGELWSLSLEILHT